MDTALKAEPVRKDTPQTADAQPTPLSPDLLRGMDAYWRAANYLSVGQIYCTTTRSCASR